MASSGFGQQRPTASPGAYATPSGSSPSSTCTTRRLPVSHSVRFAASSASNGRAAEYVVVAGAGPSTTPFVSPPLTTGTPCGGFLAGAGRKAASRARGDAASAASTRNRANARLGGAAAAAAAASSARTKRSGVGSTTGGLSLSSATARRRLRDAVPSARSPSASRATQRSRRHVSTVSSISPASSAQASPRNRRPPSSARRLSTVLPTWQNLS
mmetsp:Transcript_3655/g.14312  ORF Transcript_3655/g.14312 Transcript_3655/m.14312 type:complete len:214 (-) Transcript_3655:135-776(-)